MKSFWSYLKGENYDIGCTGASVCVYDKLGKEVAVFKGLKYAYNCAFVPRQNKFIVKTSEGTLALYSLDSMSLILKTRYSEVRAGQDFGFCFSKDGNFFYNIELFDPQSLDTRLAVYETVTFTRLKTYYGKQFSFLYHIETRNDDAFNILGYDRGDDLIIKNGYIAIFAGDITFTKKKLPIEVADRARWYKTLQMMGFTERAKKWILPPDSRDYVPLTFMELLKGYKR